MKKDQMAIREKKRVKSGYDQLGGDLYNLRYREEQEVKYEIIFSLIHVELDDLILDDGCGSGMIMDRLVGSTVGFDLSAELLATARTKLKPFHYLVQGDAEVLPFREEIFDKIISVTLIQNTPNPAEVFSEIKRVIKFRGCFVISALKKAFTFERFQKFLEDTNFSSLRFLSGEFNHDWFSYGER
jgi:ubiquinone/menaquinone biosynthesis C-methylase UbiE